MHVYFWVCLSVYPRNRNFAKVAQQIRIQTCPLGTYKAATPACRQLLPGCPEKYPVRRWQEGFSVPGTPAGLQDCELRGPLPHRLPSAGHATSKAFPTQRGGGRRGVPAPQPLSGSSTGGSAEPRGISFSRGAPGGAGGAQVPREPKPQALARVRAPELQFGAACLCLMLGDLLEKSWLFSMGDRVTGDQPFLQPGTSPGSPAPCQRTHAQPAFFLFLLQPTFSSLCRQSPREGPGLSEKPETAGWAALLPLKREDARGLRACVCVCFFFPSSFRWPWWRRGASRASPEPAGQSCRPMGPGRAR